MNRIASIVSVLPGLVPPAFAGDGVATALTADDRIAFEQVVQSQPAALRADDSKGAFGYASTGVRKKLGTPKAFILMVCERYRPVHRTRAVEFGRITMNNLGPVQHMTILGPNGVAFSAMYVMERQPGGAWKFGGCLLKPRDSRAA